MQWSDVTKAPPPKMLRQFAGLWLVVFGGLAVWRAVSGQVDGWTYTLAGAALAVGVTGLIWPAAVRPIFTGWMIVAFPIGWTVSKLALGLMFFVMFTLVGVVFRLTGRDLLRLRRRSAGSYWEPKAGSQSSADYLRQS
jgi:hypothetical protein